MLKLIQPTQGHIDWIFVIICHSKLAQRSYVEFIFKGTAIFHIERGRNVAGSVHRLNGNSLSSFHLENSSVHQAIINSSKRIQKIQSQRHACASLVQSSHQAWH
jgi:hypothetical protein